MSMPSGSLQSRPRSWPMVNSSCEAWLPGKLTRSPGFQPVTSGADLDDRAGRAVAGAEGELPVGQGGILEPLVGAGVDGQFGAGADGADLGGDEDLVRGGRGQIDLADPDAERLEDDDLTALSWECGYLGEGGGNLQEL